MPTVETLDIAVNVIDDFDQTLERLQKDLIATEGVAESVDPIKIDVDVDKSELLSTQALIEGTGGDIDVGVDRSTGTGKAMTSGGRQPMAGDLLQRFGPTQGRPMGRGRSKFENPLIQLDNAPEIPIDEAIIESDSGRAGRQLQFRGPFEITPDFKSSQRLMKTLVGGDVSGTKPGFDPGQSIEVELTDVAPGLSGEGLPGGSGRKLKRAQNSALRAMGPGRSTKGLLESMPGFERISNISGNEINKLVSQIAVLLSTFIGAIPAVVAGLVALGTAAVGAAIGLAAIGGLAALGASMGSEEGFMENLKSTAKELIESFTDAFGPIAKELAPLFDMAVDGLKQLFQDIADSGAVLLNFREEAIALGKVLGNFLADTFVRLIAFADAASRTFSAFSDTFDMNILGGLAAVLARIGDELGALFYLILEGLPGLVRLSEGFLRASLVVAFFIFAIFKVIEVLGPLGDVLAMVIGFIGLYAAGLLVASTVTNIFAGTAVAAAVKGLGSMIWAFGAQITALFGYIGTISTAIAATVAFTVAVTVLYGILTFGVVPLIGAVSSKFNILSNDIGMAADELERFSQQSDKLGAGSGAGLSSRRPSGSAYVDASSTQNNVTVNADNNEEANKMSKTYQYRQKQYDKELGS